MTSWRDVLRQRQLAIDAADREELEAKKKYEISSKASFNFSSPSTVAAAAWLLGNDIMTVESPSSDSLLDSPVHERSSLHEDANQVGDGIDALHSACGDHDTAESIPHSPADGLTSNDNYSADAESHDDVECLELDSVSTSIRSHPSLHDQYESEGSYAAPDHPVYSKHLYDTDELNSGSECLKDDASLPLTVTTVNTNSELPSDIQSPDHKRTRRHARKHGKRSRKKCNEEVNRADAVTTKAVFQDADNLQQKVESESFDYSAEPSAVSVADLSEQLQLDAVENQLCEEITNPTAVPDASTTDDLHVQVVRHLSYMKAVGIGSESSDVTRLEWDGSNIAESADIQPSANPSVSTESTDTRPDGRKKTKRHRPHCNAASVKSPAHNAAVSQEKSDMTQLAEHEESSSNINGEEVVADTDHPMRADSSKLSTDVASIVAVEGYLNYKVTHQEGKKASDRCWRTAYVVLRGKDMQFYADSLSQETGNITLTVPIRSCVVDIVYDYANKKNIFRVVTTQRSAYLFEADTNDIMLQWIYAIKQCNPADDKEFSELIQQMHSTAAWKPDITADGKKTADESASKTTRAKAVRKKAKSAQIENIERKQAKEGKTWRTKLAHRFRQSGISGTDSVDSAQSPGVFGVPLEKTVPSTSNEYVPLLVEVCIRIIEEKGLHNKGIYRVPGNTAAITSLQADIEKDPIGLNLNSDKWQDVNVVISLLKLFFRKLPESLITSVLYPAFLQANEDTGTARLLKLKELLHCLPQHNFETLRVVAQHLSAVAAVEHDNMMDTRNLSIIFGPTLLQPRDATVVGMVKDMSSQCQIVESIVLHHEWMFGAYNNPSDVIDGTECPADVILQVSTVDRLMLETAQNMAAKEEKDGDLRRLMRRVANRTKSSRRQRSKSALGHLQSIRSENNVDDVATAAAEKHKLSNDELQTASLPHKDKHKPNEMSPNLPDKHKNSLSADELKQAEKSHQHKERIGRSPTLRTRTVVSSTEKMKSRSTRPLVSLHPPQHSMSRRMAPNTLATIPRSYCGINSRSESILLFPAHSRDIFLKRSRERLASGSSSSGLIISSTGRSGGRGIGDSFSGEKSALAYLGSSSRAETSLLRRNVARNRAAHLIGCWQQSDSYPREEPKRSSFTGHETHTSSLDQKNDVEVLERAKSSNSLHSPLLTSAAMGPLLVFKKADHSYDMSPLSLSVQCGSDTDELEGAREVAVVPTHRLMSKRVWNTKACSWEDAVEHYSTDSLYSNCDSPDHYNSSDNAFLTMNQDSRKMVFAKPDIVVNTGARLCKEGVKCFASENDIARFSSRNDADIHCMPSSLSVKKAAVNATSTVDTPAKTRHSVIGIISDENHVFNCDQKTIVHLYRAKSCPELVALCQLVDSVHSVSAISHLHHRHKTPRHLNSVKKSTSKGSFRRRKAKQIVSHCTLSPPFASWPGKGDVMGSMLAYESSV